MMKRRKVRPGLTQWPRTQSRSNCQWSLLRNIPELKAEVFQYLQVSMNVLPRGDGRRSLPTDGGRPRSSGDGVQGSRPRQDGGGAAALSKSLLGSNNSRQQLGSSMMGSSNNRKGNLPIGSLQTSLSSGSISITRTPSPISPAVRDGYEPITLTVRKQ